MNRAVAETMAARAVMGWCVALAIGLIVGHYAGGASMAGTASDCRAAVDASLDEWQGVEGASVRYEEYVGRCIR